MSLFLVRFVFSIAYLFGFVAVAVGFVVNLLTDLDLLECYVASSYLDYQMFFFPLLFKFFTTK